MRANYLYATLVSSCIQGCLAYDKTSKSAAIVPEAYCFNSIYTGLSSLQWSTGSSSSNSSHNKSDHSSAYGSVSSQRSHQSSTLLDSSERSGHSRTAASNTYQRASRTSSVDIGSATDAVASPSAASHHQHSPRHGGGGGHGEATELTELTYCSNTIEVTSLYASAKLYCSAAELEAGILYWQQLCEQSKTGLMDLITISNTVTDAYIARLPTADPENNSTSTISTPVLLTESYYERAYKTYANDIVELPTHVRLGWGLMGFWGGILLLGMLNHAWNTIFQTRIDLAKADIEQAGSKAKTSSKLLAPFSALRHMIRTHIIIPASIGTHHQRFLLWCTIPKRLDMLIVLGFWALSIILSAVEIKSFTGHLTRPTLGYQNWFIVARRTGILSYACLPWVWLFAGRNNVFLWATGWSFRTFSIFHRHVARVATALAIIHSIGFAIMYYIYEPGTMAQHMEDAWFYWGVIATILAAALVVFSATWIRVKFYEFFLITHIVLAALVFYALFVHTSKFRKAYDGYLWPCVAIWSFDRFVRIVRLAICNIRVKVKGSSMVSSAVVTYSQESDVIRLEVRPGSAVKPGPGQYYYLYQPLTLRGWETILSLWVPSPVDPMHHRAALRTNQPRVGANFLHICPTKLTFVSTGSTLASKSDTSLIFWARPYDGWTKRLRDQCLKSPSPIQPSILVEGPYGHREPLHMFETVIMITGGTGIASAVPYIIDHCERSSSNNTHTTRINLIWSVRQTAYVNELCEKELAPAMERSDFEARFMCTTKSSVLASDASDNNKSSNTSTSGLPNEEKGSMTVASDALDNNKSSNTSTSDLPNEEKGAMTVASGSAPTIEYGRPDIHSIISEAAEAAMSMGTRTAILVCGPAAMADDARAAVHRAMKKGCRTMEYFEEAYGW